MSPLVVGFIVLAAVVAGFVYMTTKSAPGDVVLAALKAGAKVIDVRTVGEFKGGHYPGAVNVPVDQVAARLKMLGDPSKPIVMYCHSGMRSGSAKKIVVGKGFKNVINAGSYHRIMQITSNK
jgi:phage shock protein E